jgi:glycosyltransferase involved in cell wall biosynthesis
MLSADVFVLASRRESFGLVLIEARQTGCAIVATNVDGISEALDDGRAGVMVPPQSPEALARAISSLIGSEDERDAWRKQALNGIEDYRVSVMAGEVQSVYEELSLSPNIDTESNVVWQK